MKMHKYHGAGNDFLIIDNRGGSFVPTPGRVAMLCHRRTGVGADGLITLERSDRAPWGMRYFNSDGSGGMMCGNGGRCIAAFAHSLGLPMGEFEGPDGMHHATIVAAGGGSPTIVRLGMRDVEQVLDCSPLGMFADTGTRHLVVPVADVARVDVAAEGARLRRHPQFAPQGVNVNFVQPCADGTLRIRTFEKGVEAETLACGTGITAAALAAWHLQLGTARSCDVGIWRQEVVTELCTLTVDFVPHPGGSFTSVFLTGPARHVATVILDPDFAAELE